MGKELVSPDNATLFFFPNFMAYKNKHTTCQASHKIEPKSENYTNKQIFSSFRITYINRVSWKSDLKLKAFWEICMISLTIQKWIKLYPS